MDSKVTGHTELQGHINIIYIIYTSINICIYIIIFSVVSSSKHYNTRMDNSNNNINLKMYTHQVMHQNYSKFQRITFSLFIIR